MDQMNIKITMLQVGGGDCIHIRIVQPSGIYNIIIDSGPAGSASKFRSLLRKIQSSGERVDLLCFTHIDNDHIKGAEKVFAETSFAFTDIDRIWINIPDFALPKETAVSGRNVLPVSCESASKLMREIRRRGFPCTTKITEGEALRLGDVEVLAVSPSRERLEACYREWEKYLASSKHVPISAVSDSNPINGSSVVLLLTFGETRLLFTGDAFAKDLEDISKQCANQAGFALVKLPHHGSAANTSAEMLEAMKCPVFLISTISTTKRPSQDTVSLIGAYGRKYGEVTVYGNYRWPNLRRTDGVQIVQLTREPIRILPEWISIATE